MIDFICEHPGVVAQLLGVMGGIAGVLVGLLVTLVSWLYRKDLHNIFDKIGEVHDLVGKAHQQYLQCQIDLPQRFVMRDEFEEFLKMRKTDWDQFTKKLTDLLYNFQYHRHNKNGDLTDHQERL